jgi:hypothetical protein
MTMLLQVYANAGATTQTHGQESGGTDGQTVVGSGVVPHAGMCCHYYVPMMLMIGWVPQLVYNTYTSSCVWCV